MTSRIASAALTGRIYMGRINKAGDAFAGQKTDVTSDVLKAIIDKAAFHGGTFDVECGVKKWTVTVVEMANEQPQERRSYVDCGECPRISTGCEGRCDKAAHHQV